MNDTRQLTGTTSRRDLLRRGRKLAYVAPVVLVSVQAVSACNVSGSPDYSNNHDLLLKHYNEGRFSDSQIKDFNKKYGTSFKPKGKK